MALLFVFPGFGTPWLFLLGLGLIPSQLWEIIVKVEYVAHVTITSEALCNATLELLIFTVLPNTPSLPGQASVSLRGVHFFSFSPPGRKRPSYTTQGLKVRGTGKGSFFNTPGHGRTKRPLTLLFVWNLKNAREESVPVFRKRPTPTPQTKVRVINVP